MPRLPALAALAALAVVALAAPAPAQDADSTAARVLAAEDRRFAAMTAVDLPALDALLDDRLVYTHTDGEVDTKASLLGTIGSGEIRYLAIGPSGREVHVLGDAAVVTGRSRMRVAAGGRELAFTIRYTSVYARRPDGWRLVAWQSTRLPDS